MNRDWRRNHDDRRSWPARNFYERIKADGATKICGVRDNNKRPAPISGNELSERRDDRVKHRSVHAAREGLDAERWPSGCEWAQTSGRGVSYENSNSISILDLLEKRAQRSAHAGSLVRGM